MLKTSLHTYGTTKFKKYAKIAADLHRLAADLEHGEIE